MASFVASDKVSTAEKDKEVEEKKENGGNQMALLLYFLAEARVVVVRIGEK